jgi:hypothetical protein
MNPQNSCIAMQTGNVSHSSYKENSILIFETVKGAVPPFSSEDYSHQIAFEMDRNMGEKFCMY